MEFKVNLCDDGILDEAKAFKLKIRISTGADVEVVVSPNFTVHQVGYLIKKQKGWEQDVSFMILHFGKILQPTSTLEASQVDGRTLLQVFVQ